MHLHLRPNLHSPLVSAQFGNCLIDQLTDVDDMDELPIDLSTTTTAGQLELCVEPTQSSGSHQYSSKSSSLLATGIILRHASRCPARYAIRQLGPIPQNLADKQVRIAAAVLPIHHQTGHLLLTRRTESLRIFPGCWVFPGGAVDEHEELITAAAREVLEETGLTCSDLKPLCAWESCWPTESMPVDHPRAHHLLLFYTATVVGNLRLQAMECDAAIWLSPEQVNWLQTRHAEPDGVVEVFDETGSCFNLPGDQMHGAYPNATGKGTAKGHLFALEQYAKLQRSVK